MILNKQVMIHKAWNISRTTWLLRTVHFLANETPFSMLDANSFFAFSKPALFIINGYFRTDHIDRTRNYIILFLQTSHTHSEGQEDIFPPLLYGQAVPWMQRKEVQSPKTGNALVLKQTQFETANN